MLKKESAYSPSQMTRLFMIPFLLFVYSIFCEMNMIGNDLKTQIHCSLIPKNIKLNIQSYFADKWTIFGNLCI